MGEEEEEASGAVSGQRPSGRIGWNWRCPLSGTKLVPAHEIEQIGQNVDSNIWQYLQFSAAAVEYLPILNIGHC